MNFEQFKDKWLGDKVDYDHVWNYQCVDLIRQYIYECYSIAGGGGVPSAISYWTITPEVILEKFEKVASSDARAGDIVMLYGLPGNADGHIGIGTGRDTDSDIEILEQNGSSGNGDGQDGNAIRTRYVSRSRVAGLLRPKQVAQAPVEPLYWVEEIDPKLVKTNKDPTCKWGMNYDAAYMPDHAISSRPLGDIFTAVAKVHHQNGYTYYKDSLDDPDGYNVLDCDSYTPPEPPVIEPPKTTPAAPVNFPATDEKFVLVTTVKAYTTSNSAINDVNAVGTVSPGSYFIYNRRAGNDGNLAAVNISKVRGQAGAWVRVEDNVVPEPPKPVQPVVEAVPVVVAPKPQPKVETEADVRKTYEAYNIDGSPISCRVTMSYPMEDRLLNGLHIELKKGRTINIYGTFRQGGKLYALARLKSDTEKHFMYGIPIVTRFNLGPYLKEMNSIVDQAKALFEKYYGPIVKTIDGFIAPKTRR